MTFKLITVVCVVFAFLNLNDVKVTDYLEDIQI